MSTPIPQSAGGTVKMLRTEFFVTPNRVAFLAAVAEPGEWNPALRCFASWRLCVNPPSSKGNSRQDTEVAKDRKEKSDMTQHLTFARGPRWRGFQAVSC